MIEWIEKLPDSLTGAAVAGFVWFGFNYTVLAERAIEKAHAQAIVPNCASVLEAQTKLSMLRPSGLGEQIGIPHMDRIERLVIESVKPRMLTLIEREDRCTCAARRAGQKLRFDYAVHTASFRIVSPQAVSDFADNTAAIALSGTCGVIPNPLKGAAR
ncbi:MAG: hypothetical protein B7Y08_06530 [Rhodospirillales bacterium 24-66-33]|jgi:hypothetical protein|uniref:hypothetical protein n=1 Tax=Reyranella sp. TaxID=1929291 RepID=UPI000BD31042|nr:hypothetical protein [Reyranella sp.]OYY41106.1 MAG: hypothetical protein B7Y57_16270 [Rhodospirillales bacterium 35-66-84]OYZ96076.1 MAG: hypothetical protein B7Y08_06530 [Rhodospirillales bacterium 24-66-33]OZB21211.1 MAG: hypothetical protein B7X63_27995 [Rhodospirillales bacterium 39-66-50]HQS14894.1 hypothetical protein [Reyranella sp.]HQT14281.1 hypothetical protein [Reyranella sp.]